MFLTSFFHANLAVAGVLDENMFKWEDWFFAAYRLTAVFAILFSFIVAETENAGSQTFVGAFRIYI